jgi:methionine-rich copper-binding protein CopC
MGILSIKTIGIDLYDMPLCAVNSDGDKLEKTNIHYILKDTSTVAMYDETIDEIIDHKKYWGDFELTQALLKFAINSLRPKLMKPRILISVPYDISKGRFGELYKRMIHECVIQAGGKEEYLIENIYCASLGAKLPTQEQTKLWTLYSNEWCTYLYMTYAGAIVMAETIEKPYNMINVEEIESTFKSMLLNVPANVSKLFKVLNLDRSEINNLETNWLKPSEKKLNMIVPDSMRFKHGQWMSDYQLIYSDNYEHCIVDGLGHMIKAVNYILKPKNKKNTFTVF